MRLKLILSVCVAFFFCISCHEDEVDTAYLLSVEQLVITDYSQQNELKELCEIFIDSLIRREYIGEMEFSGESRAENDKLAKEKFGGKCESILGIDLKSLFGLQSGETVYVKFYYILSRGKEELAREERILFIVPGVSE